MEIKITKRVKIAFRWYNIKEIKVFKNWIFAYTYYDVIGFTTFQIILLGFAAGILFYHKKVKIWK